MITLKKTLVYNTELNERRILIKSLLQLFVVIIVLIVYFPVLGHDFLYFWDDQWVVMNRYTEGGFNIYNLWAIFTEYYHGQYAPLNETLYLILYSLFGYDPFTVGSKKGRNIVVSRKRNTINPAPCFPLKRKEDCPTKIQKNTIPQPMRLESLK